MSEFAKTIFNLRKNKKLTLEALANKVGVVRSYLSKLENDRVETKPSEDVLRGLSRELGIEFEKLSLLAGRMTRSMIDNLDIKKVEIFRAMKDRTLSDKQYKDIMNKIKKNDTQK